MILPDMEILDIEFHKLSRRKIVGLSEEIFLDDIKEVWDIAFEKEILKSLEGIEDEIYYDIGKYIGLGYTDSLDTDKKVEYTIGKFTGMEAIVPKDLNYKIFPEGKAAKIYLQGKSIEIVEKVKIRNFCSKAIEKTGHMIDKDNFYFCDIYTLDGYVENLKNGKDIILECLMSVIEI